MKMDEYETRMADLAAVSGLSREMLDKTPARVLFTLSNALQERDRAVASREALLGEIARVDNECRTLGCKRKSAYPVKEMNRG